MQLSPEIKNYFDSRFEQVSKHFDSRFEQVSKHFDSRFEQVSKHFDSRFEQVSKYLDTKFEEQSQKFVSKEYFDQQLDQKLDQKLGEKLGYLDQRTKTMALDIVEIKNKLEEVSQRDLADSNAFKSIVLNHDARIKALERKVRVSMSK